MAGGSYLVGSPLGAPTNTLWGQLRLAVSVNVPSGTAIVGAFSRAAAIYRRAALRIDLSEKSLRLLRAQLGGRAREQREASRVKPEINERG